MSGEAKRVAVMWKDEDEADGIPIGPCWFRLSDGGRESATTVPGSWVPQVTADAIGEIHGLPVEYE